MIGRPGVALQNTPNSFRISSDFSRMFFMRIGVFTLRLGILLTFRRAEPVSMGRFKTLQTSDLLRRGFKNLKFI